MKLIMESWRRFKKGGILREGYTDYGSFRNKDLNTILAEMNANLSNKTLVFFDLETIESEDKASNQITQIAAFSYKIQNLDDGIGAIIPDEYLTKIGLGDVTSTLRTKQSGWGPEERADAETAYKAGGGWGKFMTVDDLLAYQHYDDYMKGAETVDEKTGINGFFDFLETLGKDGSEIILIAHNLIYYDRKKLIARAGALGLKGLVNFESLSTFDSYPFASSVFGKVVRIVSEDPNKTEAKKLVNDLSIVKEEFSMALASLLHAFAEGATQLHTADDDTKRLVMAFFKMYGLIKNYNDENPELSNLYVQRIKIEKDVIKKIQNMLGGWKDDRWKAISKEVYKSVKNTTSANLASLNSNPTELGAFIKSLQGA